LPTRRDIDGLARRMHDTRRELARLRAAVVQAETSRRNLGRRGPIQAKPGKPQT